MPADAVVYPVNLIVNGKRCLVVGGDVVAAGKVAGLLKAGAVVKVVSPRVEREIRALGVQFEERAYKTSDLIGVRLVIAATSNPQLNKTIHDEADALGVWVKAAEDPANCSFILPATVRRGPLLLTASTGGLSPALSSWLRRRLEGEYGDEFEVLLDLLSTERASAKAEGRKIDPADWQRALDSDMLD